MCADGTGMTSVVVVDRDRLVDRPVVDVESGWEGRLDVSVWIAVSVSVSVVVEDSASEDGLVDQEDGVHRREGVGGVGRVVVVSSVLEGGASLSEVAGRSWEVDVSDALRGPTAKNVARRKRSC